MTMRKLFQIISLALLLTLVLTPATTKVVLALDPLVLTEREFSNLDSRGGMELINNKLFNATHVADQMWRVTKDC